MRKISLCHQFEYRPVNAVGFVLILASSNKLRQCPVPLVSSAWVVDVTVVIYGLEHCAFIQPIRTSGLRRAWRRREGAGRFARFLGWSPGVWRPLVVALSYSPQGLVWGTVMSGTWRGQMVGAGPVLRAHSASSHLPFLRVGR